MLFPGLATSRTNSYIAIGAGSFIDTAGNPLLEVPTTSSVQVDRYVPDTTSPRLLSFELDINTGFLTLTFDDVIDIMSVIPSSISLQNEESLGPSTTSVSLTNAIPSGSNDFSVTIELISTDLNALKAELDIATNENDTYIVLGTDAFLDVAGSLLVAVLPAAALQATSVTPDITPPELSSFSFDASLGILSLMFTEVVNVSAINSNGIILQNAMFSPSLLRRLTGGTPSTTDPAQNFNFTLSRDDINYIKAFPDFGTDVSNTYLAVESTTVSDTNSNPLIAIPASGAQPASEHEPDGVPPVLESYALNLDTGILDLTFTETVDTPTLDPNVFLFNLRQLRALLINTTS